MLWVNVYLQEPAFGKHVCPEKTEIKTESVKNLEDKCDVVGQGLFALPSACSLNTADCRAWNEHGTTDEGFSKIVVSINCYFLKLMTKGSYDKMKLWSHSKLNGNRTEGASRVGSYRQLKNGHFHSAVSHRQG